MTHFGTVARAATPRVEVAKSGIGPALAAATYFVMLTMLYAVAASQAMWSFSYKWTTIASHPQYALDKVLDGSAPKPYAYRVLIPQAVNRLVDVIPTDIARPMIERSRNTLQATIGVAAADIDDRTTLAYGVILQLGFVCLLATMFVLRGLARSLMGPSSGRELIYDLSPILFSLVLTITYRPLNGFVYDHFELFALTTYVYMVAGNRRVAALASLALAITNKETAILYPVFGGIIRWYKAGGAGIAPKEKMASVLEVMAAVMIFITVRVLLQSHPGSSVQWHFLGNAVFWLSTEPWVAMTTPHLQIIPVPKPSNMVILLPLIVVMCGYWSKKPPVVRALLLASGMINVPLFVLFAYRDEFRNLSLMYPFLFLAATHSICAYGGSRPPMEGHRLHPEGEC